MVREMDRQPPDVAAVYANQKIWHLTAGGAWREGPVLRGRPLRSKYEVMTQLAVPCPRLYRKQALAQIGGFPAVIGGRPCLPVDYFTMLMLAERYRFHWLDAPVYHRSMHGTAHGQVHKTEYAAQYRMIVRRMLARWKSPYIPEFTEERGALTMLSCCRSGVSEARLGRAGDAGLLQQLQQAPPIAGFGCGEFRHLRRSRGDAARFADDAGTTSSIPPDGASACRPARCAPTCRNHGCTAATHRTCRRAQTGPAGTPPCCR